MSDRHRTELLIVFAVALGIFVAYQVRHVLLLIYISALSSVVIGQLNWWAECGSESGARVADSPF